MGSSFGELFRITTFGESHGGGVGVVIDGCPPRIPLGEAEIQRELDRRRPGQSAIVSPRDEADRCEILSGVFEGQTLGTPIAILARNQDARPEAYREMKDTGDLTPQKFRASFGVRPRPRVAFQATRKTHPALALPKKAARRRARTPKAGAKIARFPPLTKNQHHCLNGGRG